jgi:methylglutaconyl-CoA hydratase
LTNILENRDSRGVLWLTLNRPEIHNAFDHELVQNLRKCLRDTEQDPSIRIVVLTGAGSSFSAGADMNWMRNMANASEQENEQDALQLAELMRTLNYLDLPTIAMINGPAFGGGLGLIACCDIAIAAESARFGLTETTLGLVPAVISPYVFRRIGESNARRYFMTGERFVAQKAEEMGLVHEVVTADLLAGAVEKVIGSLLMAAPGAVLASKKLINAVAGHDQEQQQEQDIYTSKLIAKLRVSREGQEGMSAFLEKRSPAWIKTENG